MRINLVNQTNFNGHIKMTPTAKRLIETADTKVQKQIFDIAKAMEYRDDSLAYTFANSRSKRNGEDYFHIALIEENTKETGYRVARKIVEISGKYIDTMQACSSNKNLLNNFIPFFSNKYKEELDFVKQ